ncbi:MAG: YciI family protein [Sulfuritalea sp.]|nr:YciI family protein [Sulfuritalea sp.]
MLYAIVGEDVPNSLEKRMASRPTHLARLLELEAAGRMVLAGPFPAIDSPDPGPAGFSGSLIVAEFNSLEEAQAWANADPYLSAGVYDKVTVRPFKQALPKS